MNSHDEIVCLLKNHAKGKISCGVILKNIFERIAKGDKVCFVWPGVRCRCVKQLRPKGPFQGSLIWSKLRKGSAFVRSIGWSLTHIQCVESGSLARSEAISCTRAGRQINTSENAMCRICGSLSCDYLNPLLLCSVAGQVKESGELADISYLFCQQGSLRSRRMRWI
jgi:hypothetical protein